MYRVVPYLGIPRQRGFRGGGEESKRRQFSRGGGLITEGFFSGDLGNIGELFINNSQFLC